MSIAALIGKDELNRITAKSDLLGAWVVFSQWTLTIAIFAVVAWWTTPLTVVLGTLLLGGRQLGFFVLTHECGHKTLFATQRLNDWVGDWLLSAPDYTNMRAYMREHLEHHRSVGTDDDPDLMNYADYPISSQRLRRKLIRDITGQTGWRILAHKLDRLVHLNRQDAETRACLVRGLIVNMAILAALMAAGHGLLYLMWLAAIVFVQPLVSRIRQIAEHAAVPDLASSDPRENTRTVLAHPFVRLFICPHGVNYHIEHHLLASVPIYRLPKLHACLHKVGYFKDVAFTDGYAQMLRQVTRVSAPA